MPTHAKVGVTQNSDGEDVSALLIYILGSIMIYGSIVNNGRRIAICCSFSLHLPNLQVS